LGFGCWGKGFFAKVSAKLVLTAEQTAEIERLRKKPAWIRAAAGKAKHKSVLASQKLASLRFNFVEAALSGSLYKQQKIKHKSQKPPDDFPLRKYILL